MLAELVASVICIFVFWDNLWLVVAIVLLNFYLWYLMVIIRFRKDYAIVNRKLLNSVLDDTSKLLDKTLEIANMAVEIQGILSFSFMPINVLSKITKTSEKDLMLWVEHDILPYVGPKDFPLINGIFVAYLLSDDEGKVHFSDDFHKPLTAADVKHAVELMKKKETDHA